MKNLKLFLMLTLISAFVFISCDNDVNSDLPQNDDPISENTINYDFGNNVSRSFLGEILDKNNNPIQGVDVTIGNSNAVTDENGVFIINDVSIKENFAYIQATKIGYIKGTRALVPTEGVNRVKIMLLDATVIATVNSGTESSVTLPNDSQVDFSGNFKKEDGTSYTGTVDVIMHHLDPSDPNIEEKMPGMLLASNENNEARVLETFGMINVELIGSGGEKLQIADDATIKMPIDNAQSSSAPTTIPLWHFDEEEGYWVEEGSATKSGDFYVGTVSHFSWWNCDAQFPTVNLCLKVVNEDNEPLSNVRVLLIPEDQTYGRSGTSNANGDIYGLIPKDKTLTMNVEDHCGNVISTSTIGPFSSNTVLPNIVITDNMERRSVTVVGNLAKCDYTDVTNGYVTFAYGSKKYYSVVTDGNFTFNTTTCNSNLNFTLTGYNFDDLENSGEVSYVFPENQITNVGTLVTCNSVEEYITYQIDDNPIQYFVSDINASIWAYIDPNDPNMGGPEELSVTASLNNMRFGLNSVAVTPGTYDSGNISLITNEVSLEFGSSNDVVFNITRVEGYIDISFSGTYPDPNNSGETRRITGIVHVIRDN